MIRLSGATGAALFGVSLSIPSPQLQSPLHVIFSAPSSHPHPALTLPVSGRYPLADEMMSHMFDVYCLYLGGGCEGILSSQNTTIHFSNYWIGICTLTQRTVSPSTVFSTVYTISMIYFCVFYILLSVALFIWLLLLRLASEANNGTGQLGRGQGVIVGIMATLACIIQQLPTSHTLHTPWYSD